MTDQVEPMLNLIPQLGVAAILAWHLYYTTSVSNPKAMETALNRMDAMQDRHNKTIDDICKDFTTTIREERLARREEINMLRDELRAYRGLSDSVNRPQS